MKKIILLIAVLGLLIILGCKEQPPQQIEKKECIADSDCVVGGCSGTVCQSKNAEPIFTTCEWKEEYGCYKQINCKCIESKCQWDKTQEFDECVVKAREPLNN